MVPSPPNIQLFPPFPQAMLEIHKGPVVLTIAVLKYIHSIAPARLILLSFRVWHLLHSDAHLSNLSFWRKIGPGCMQLLAQVFKVNAKLKTLTRGGAERRIVMTRCQNMELLATAQADGKQNGTWAGLGATQGNQGSPVPAPPSRLHCPTGLSAAKQDYNAHFFQPYIHSISWCRASHSNLKIQM